MKLQLTQCTQQDLVRLREFIAIKNPQAAKRYSQRLKKHISKLLDHPAMGHPVEELPGVRELVAGDYVVRYIVLNDELTVLRIWHGKEAWP